MEALTLSMIGLLAVIARLGMATKTVGITSPLADVTIESISAGGSDVGTALTA